MDGKWGTWNGWLSCTNTCGKGTRSRQRSCGNPTPSNGGKQCVGGIKELDECESKACPGTYIKFTCSMIA